MANNETSINIYMKLVEVRKTVKYLQKSNEGHQYKYVSSSQVLDAVREKMDELNLLLMVEVVNKNLIIDTVENVDKYNNTKRTSTYFTELDLKYTWVNAENPQEKIEIPFYAQGVDIAGEKGVGKALTYAEKYFLLKQFNISTDKDDPDSHQKKSEGNEGDQNQNNQQQRKQYDDQKKQQKAQSNNKAASEAQIKYVKSLVSKLAKARNIEEEMVTETMQANGLMDGSIDDISAGQAKVAITSLNGWIKSAEQTK
jgi:hypothetical protein